MFRAKYQPIYCCQAILQSHSIFSIHRQRPENVLTRFQKLKPGDAAISIITWGELLNVFQFLSICEKGHEGMPRAVLCGFCIQMGEYR